MLGFVLGALSIMALPKRPPAEAVPAAQAAPRPAPKPTPRTVSTIEAVFAEWEKYASWSEGTTEVALWDPGTHGFTDCYEVRRIGDSDFFRTIPALTRPVITRGVPTGSPLQFTETVQQHQEWLAEVRAENWRQINQGVHDSLAPSPTPPAAP
jgi:hypothetical protein